MARPQYVIDRNAAREWYCFVWLESRNWDDEEADDKQKGKPVIDMV